MTTLLLLGFLFLKTGEKFATQEAAGPTVGAFTDAVAAAVGGVQFKARVLNEPAKAVEYVAGQKPAVGIVTPGFYLAYAKALGMEALLETRRQGVAAERYVLVARGDAGGDLAAVGTIATTLAAEERFLLGVVLQDKWREVRLKPVGDLEGAAFDLAEKSKNAADAVLMEEGTWVALAKDEELGPKLKVIYRSEELPGPLVVAFGANVGGLDLEKLKAALKGTDAAVLSSIRVERFVDVDGERLKKAEARFYGK